MVGLVVVLGTGEFVLVAGLPVAVCFTTVDDSEVFTYIRRAFTSLY